MEIGEYLGMPECLAHEKVDLDFSQPLSAEDIADAKEIAEKIVHDKMAPFITNVDYVRSCGTPLFAYQVLKNLIPLMEQNNFTITMTMRDALNNPQEYFNPYYVAKRDDEMVDLLSSSYPPDD